MDGKSLPAVVVFPTPGAPCRRMIRPFPILKLAKVVSYHKGVLTFATDNISLSLILRLFVPEMLSNQ